MDRKLAKDNIHEAFELSKNLNHRNYKEAEKNIKQEKHYLLDIDKEIKSGKAKKERH